MTKGRYLPLSHSPLSVLCMLIKLTQILLPAGKLRCIHFHLYDEYNSDIVICLSSSLGDAQITLINSWDDDMETAWDPREDPLWEHGLPGPTLLTLAESIIPFNIWRSRDFSPERNVHKNSISGDCECRIGPHAVDKWTFSNLPLVNKGRERKKKANTTIQAFPFCWPGSLSNLHLLGRCFQTEKADSFHTNVTRKRQGSFK